MLRRTVFITILAAFTAVLASGVSPAAAEIHVPFRLDQIKMNYTAADNRLTVLPNSMMGGLYVQTQDTLGGLTPELSLIKFSSFVDQFDFILDLTLADKPGDNQWAGSGYVKIDTKVDAAGDPLAVPRTVMLADFSATKWVFDDAEVQAAPMGFVEKEFRIVGTLMPYSGGPHGGPQDSILLDGEPWEFSGFDAAGDIDTLSVDNAGSYDGGQLTTIHFKVNVEAGVSTLDDLFAGDRSALQGDAFGKVVPVPVPAAALLGLVGLSIVGIRMRRYA